MTLGKVTDERAVEGGPRSGFKEEGKGLVGGGTGLIGKIDHRG